MQVRNSLGQNKTLIDQMSLETLKERKELYGGKQ